MLAPLDEPGFHTLAGAPESPGAPAATGSPEQCVEAVRGQFALGCDGVILHGATPAELAPVVTAYRERMGK